MAAIYEITRDVTSWFQHRIKTGWLPALLTMAAIICCLVSFSPAWAVRPMKISVGRWQISKWHIKSRLMPKTHRQETYKKEQMNKVPSAIITIHLSLMRLPSVSRLHPPQRCDRSRLLITRSRCEINPELQHLLAASSYLSNKHIKLMHRLERKCFSLQF